MTTLLDRLPRADDTPEACEYCGKPERKCLVCGAYVCPTLYYASRCTCGWYACVEEMIDREVAP